MKILLVDNGSIYISKLRKLSRASRVINWRKLNLNICKRYDLIILSGGYLSVINHKKEFKRELDLIKNIRKPLIGICLGSELIAFNYGARLVRLRIRDHGKRIISEGKNNLTVYESRRWAIRSVPSQLKVIGRSKDGIEIFRHKTKPIVGLQFHPEVLVTRTDGAKLFKAILKELT